MAHAQGEGVGGGQRIGARKGPVAEQQGGIHPAGHGLPQQPLHRRDAHAEGAHRAAQLFFQPHRLFHGVGVKGVDHRLPPIPDDGLGLRVQFDFIGGRYLFDTHDDLHFASSSAANRLPRLSRHSGSKASLSRRICRMCSGPYITSKNPAFSLPTPCSAETGRSTKVCCQNGRAHV